MPTTTSLPNHSPTYTTRNRDNYAEWTISMLKHSIIGLPRFKESRIDESVWESSLLSKPVLEPRSFGRHKERPDISALGSHGSADMFDITICHPLSPARIRHGLENPLTLLKNAWEEKIRRFRRVREASATAAKLFPMPISTL